MSRNATPAGQGPNGSQFEDLELLAFAPLEIDKAFTGWSATTTEKSGVILWSGKNSEALYLLGDPVKGTWQQWARTSKGRYFYVVYEYQSDEPVAVDLVTDVTADDLTKVLMKEKRLDLVKEYGLKIAGA